MKKYVCLLVSVVLWSGAAAQKWQPDSTALHFPPTDAESTSTRQVWVKNDGAEFITITNVDGFEQYGEAPFSVSDSSFTIAPQDSTAFSVHFHPQHNILYEQVVVLKSDNGFGHRVIRLRGQGTYRKSYYRTTRNKSEEQLKTTLKTLTGSNYNSLGYTTARDRMYGSIDNNGGTVEDVYTGRTANFSTRSGANNNSFNTEHSFPQGFYNKNEPMRSDIHHLFPCDVSANSRRSNHPFGVVNNPSWSKGGSKSDGSTFEPRDVHKGDAARAMMYFVIRYRDYSNHFKGQENILRQWHRGDTVSSQELQRNKDVYAQQKNRNPFVDYPQYERRISSFVSNSKAPVRYESYLSDDTLKVIQGWGGYTYHFVLYNEGNAPLSFANFALSSAAGGLLFGQGNPGTFTLNPGVHRVIAINYDGSQSYSNAQLTFTERQGNTSVNHQVPVVSEGAIGLAENATAEPLFSIAPNPVEGQLQIQGVAEAQHISIYNAMGMEVLSLNINKSQNTDNLKTLSVAHLSSGLYQVLITSTKQPVVAIPFVKR